MTFSESTIISYTSDACTLWCSLVGGPALTFSLTGSSHETATWRHLQSLVAEFGAPSSWFACVPSESKAPWTYAVCSPPPCTVPECSSFLLTVFLFLFFLKINCHSIALTHCILEALFWNFLPHLIVNILGSLVNRQKTFQYIFETENVCPFGIQVLATSAHFPPSFEELTCFLFESVIDSSHKEIIN